MLSVNSCRIQPYSNYKNSYKHNNKNYNKSNNVSFQRTYGSYDTITISSVAKQTRPANLIQKIGRFFFDPGTRSGL